MNSEQFPEAAAPPQSQLHFIADLQATQAPGYWCFLIDHQYFLTFKLQFPATDRGNKYASFLVVFRKQYHTGAHPRRVIFTEIRSDPTTQIYSGLLQLENPLRLPMREISSLQRQSIVLVLGLIFAMRGRCMCLTCGR